MSDTPTSPNQEFDASDTFDEQLDNVPVENIKAPVEKTPSKPEIPKEDAKEAQEAKDELKSEDNE